MKYYILIASLLTFLSIPIVSYATESTNNESGEIRVIGILEEDITNSPETEENQFPPKEDISAIIKNPDKQLPKMGGNSPYISSILGAILLVFDVVIYIRILKNKKKGINAEKNELQG
ncbi:hypothetical protein ACUXG3_005130 [Bacillus thuringiensis]